MLTRGSGNTFQHILADIFSIWKGTCKASLSLHEGPVNVETTALTAELRLHRDAVAQLLARPAWMAGDADLCELLRLGVDEDTAVAAVERWAIIDEGRV